MLFFNYHYLVIGRSCQFVRLLLDEILRLFTITTNVKRDDSTTRRPLCHLRESIISMRINMKFIDSALDTRGKRSRKPLWLWVENNQTHHYGEN